MFTISMDFRVTIEFYWIVNIHIESLISSKGLTLEQRANEIAHFDFV